VASLPPQRSGSPRVASSFSPCLCGNASAPEVLGREGRDSAAA
jgi:hypothetical protein